MAAPIHIGDVRVIRGEPTGSPLLDDALCGAERQRALARFMQGDATDGLTFWYTPWGGPVQRLETPDDIDWATSGVMT
jgi:hypothetical protein